MTRRPIKPRPRQIHDLKPKRIKPVPHRIENLKPNPIHDLKRRESDSEG